MQPRVFERAGPQGEASEGRLLLVSRLRHPAFAPAPPATTHEVSRTWYGLEAPAAQARELANCYPLHPRTPAQTREAAAVRRLALEMLRAAGEAVPAAPNARGASSSTATPAARGIRSDG